MKYLQLSVYFCLLFGLYWCLLLTIWKMIGKINSYRTGMPSIGQNEPSKRNGGANETQHTVDDTPGDHSVPAATTYEAIEPGGCAPPVIVPVELSLTPVGLLYLLPSEYIHLSSGVALVSRSALETAWQTEPELPPHLLPRWWRYKR